MLLVKHLLLLVLSYNFILNNKIQGLPFNDSPILFIYTFVSIPKNTTKRDDNT